MPKLPAPCTTRRRVCLGMVAVALGQHSGMLRAEPDAQALLAASDAVRNPDTSFSVTNTLTEYRHGQQTDSTTLAVLSRTEGAGGALRSLVRYIAPARDANKLLLYNGHDLWFYDPSSRASIRLSPQQRLLGQASNGDVVTANLAQDYTATMGVQEEIVDGERLRRPCQELVLVAHTPLVSYPRIHLWIDARSHQPVKARYFSDSEQLLKTAFFRRPSMALGRERPTETVIIDGLAPQWITVMRLSDWTRREVPEAWLQRDYLPRFVAP